MGVINNRMGRGFYPFLNFNHGYREGRQEMSKSPFFFQTDEFLKKVSLTIMFPIKATKVHTQMRKQTLVVDEGGKRINKHNGRFFKFVGLILLQGRKLNRKVDLDLKLMTQNSSLFLWSPQPMRKSMNLKILRVLISMMWCKKMRNLK